jgi:hypothetical protein
MILTPPERKTLDEVMAELFSTVADLEAFLSVNLGENLQSFVVDNLTVSRAKVIDRAQRLGWLVNLIEELHPIATPEQKDKLNTIGTIEELKAGRFFDDCYPNNEPLVNRKDLRDKLRVASSPGSSRILLIKGDRRYSGKSHARNHLRYIATRLGMPFAEFALSEYAIGTNVQPSIFGPDIASALDKPYPTQFDEKDARWSLNFLGWLRHQVADGFWIAFDDFEKEKVTVPQSVYDFIQLLALRIQQMPNVRLFLINYDGSLPTELGFYMQREDVPEIDEGDISDFFVDFYNKHLPLTPMAVASDDAAIRAKNVMAKVANDPAARLASMRQLLRDECEALKKEKK